MFWNFNLTQSLIALIFLSATKLVFSVKYDVRSSEELIIALNIVNPGDQIELHQPNKEDPDYPWLFGNFEASRNGTVDAPITIFGKSADVGLTTNASFVHALAVIGNHWIVKGFKIVATRSDGCGISLFRNQWTTIQNLEIIASTYGANIWGSSDCVIENCSITSSYISIRIVGDTSPFITERNKILNNKLIYSGYSTPNGSSNAIGIFVVHNNGRTCCSRIENNVFTWTSAAYQHWVYLSGDTYFIVNNTGSTVGYGGFYVQDSGYAQTSRNNTFQLNHCTNITQGYCIKVDPGLISSTCIWTDNSYDFGDGLSNMEERCDSPEIPTTTQCITSTTTTHKPESCTPDSKTTTITTTDVKISPDCPDMVLVTTVTTTTTTTLENMQHGHAVS